MTLPFSSAMRRILSLLLFFAAATAGAQDPPDSAASAVRDTVRSWASVSGAVYDSINGGPLVGAIVRLNGDTPRETITVGDGRFMLDSVAPGDYVLEVRHPLLLALGISLLSPKFTLDSGATFNAQLGVPGPRTVVELSCSPAMRARGPSAMVGAVLDADTDAPLPGAKVSLVWRELSLRDLRQVPRVREATVGEDGLYRLCGLPATIEGTFLAEYKGSKTAEITVRFDETTPLAFQSMRIGTSNQVVQVPVDSVDSAAAGAAQQGAGAQQRTTTLRSGQARLSGRVVNAAGQPVAQARVDVVGTAGAVLTNERGEFSLANLPSGTQQLIVRQLGFAPVETAVVLSAREPQNVTVALREPARVLTQVEVTAEAEPAGLDKVGFNHRRKAGFGYYMDPEDLARRQAIRITDVFRSIPSLRVVPQGMDYVVRSARDATGGCVAYIIDGAPFQSLFPGDVDRMLPAQDLAAVEVYSPSNVPAEFASPGSGTSCTTIVLWSKYRVNQVRR